MLADGIYDIQQLLLNPLFAMPQLDGKLKWLVAQNCRGKIISIGDWQFDTEEDTYHNYHYISYCTEEGTLSRQLKKSTENGKVFIQMLCAELVRNAHRLTLDDMLDNISAAVVAYSNEEIERFLAEKLYEMNTALKSFVADSIYRTSYEIKQEVLKFVMLYANISNCPDLNEILQATENAIGCQPMSSNSPKLSATLDSVATAVRPYLREIFVKFIGISVPNYQRSCADKHKFWRD